MLFPTRCWSCGKVIGNLWERYKEEMKMAKTFNPSESLGPLFNKMNLKRICCRTMFLTYYEQYEEAMKMGFPEDFSSS